MAVEGGMKCVKFLVFIFNFIFWLCGVALLAIGIYVLVALRPVVAGGAGGSSSPLAVLVLGALIFFISFLGCCGAWRESYCMVTTFAVLLAIIFLAEVATAISGYLFKDKVRPVAQEWLWEAVGTYGQDQPLTELLDRLQQEFQCCGVANYSDWATVPAFGANDSVPLSCCRREAPGCNLHPSPATVYEKGCLQGLAAWLKQNLLLVVAVATGIAVFEILGVVFACCLMRGIRSGYEVM